MIPTLSIVMPVYNTEKYIKETMQSLLNQTYTDFELIVIDDACTDQSIENIKSFNDKRIKIIKNETNKGIVFSRNRGNSEAAGKYIAPFDSDDIALPDKFEKQIKFMEEHPEFAMLGTWAKLIDENGQLKNINWKLSAPAEKIPAIQLFRAYFIQSAVVFRREVLKDAPYTEGYAPSEDYKLYYDIAKINKTYNYPGFLTLYRIHQQSITQSKAELCKDSEIKLYKYIYKPLEIEIDENYYSLLLLIKNDAKIESLLQLKAIEDFLLLILHQNSKYHIYDPKQLCHVVFNRWAKVCYKSKRNHINTISRFAASSILTQYLRNL